MPEDKDSDDDDDGDTYVGEELVDPVAGGMRHTARSFSPSKLEPLRDLPLGVGGFTECNVDVENYNPGSKMQNISSKTETNNFVSV